MSDNVSSSSVYSEIEFLNLCTEEELNLYCTEALNSLEESNSDNDNTRDNIRGCGSGGISSTQSLRVGLDGFQLNSGPDDNIENDVEHNNSRKRSRNQTSNCTDDECDDESNKKNKAGENCIKHTNFLREINRIDKRVRILHDVVYFENIGEFYEELSNSLGRTRRVNILICCTHNDHVHIVHDCSYTEGRCRCTIIKSLRARGVSRSRYSTWHWEFDRRYINVFYLKCC